MTEHEHHPENEGSSKKTNIPHTEEARKPAGDGEKRAADGQFETGKNDEHK
jgi:hypothetical protein